jgi:hypothetical protein
MRGALAALAAAALMAPTAALADDATPAEVRALAARAADDGDALAALRRVDRVGGEPVDLRRALDVDGMELERRLAALARGGEGMGAEVVAARAEAVEILEQRRFEGSGPPKPFDRFLDWLGGQLRPLGRPFEWLAGWIPGGAATLWTALAIAVVLGAAAFAAWLGRRRGGLVVERLTRADGDQGLDPDRLDRLAEEAERSGDLELALRLRFRAGLVRLARKRAVPRPETLTSRQLVRLLGSEEFDRLARDLDEVVYGGRAATPADLEAAKTGWPAVLAAAGK